MTAAWPNPEDKGFIYEPPDPEVGLMVGGWMHDPCPSANSVEHEEDQCVSQDEVRHWYKGEGYARGVVTVYRLHCSWCGETAEAWDEDWSPDGPDPSEEDVIAMLREDEPSYTEDEAAAANADAGLDDHGEPLR